MFTTAYNGKERHRTMSSEVPHAAPLASPERSALRIASRPESVAGYCKRAGGAPKQGPLELAGLVPPRPRSAAEASFGTTTMTEVVNGDDDRTAVPDPKELPWRHVCALRIRSQSGKEYVGTGWFIGAHTLMTAGHCVYLHGDGGWPDSITVIPALNGNVEPYGEVVARRYRATKGWVETRDTNVDYGAIQLDDPVGSAAGWFSFAAYEDEMLQANDASIAGYPYDLDHATRMYFHTRRVTSLSPQKMFYDIDTYGGQSGSPIWFVQGAQRIAVGIHTTGSSTSNSGTRITPEVFQNMVSWRSEVAGGVGTSAAAAGVPANG
jgi:glutamyl endopeptidase